MVRRTNLNCSSLLYDSISYVREMCLQGKYEFQTLRSNQAPAAYYVRSNNWIIVEFHYLDQGLVYLDGRNSQKYLHQTQADF